MIMHNDSCLALAKVCTGALSKTQILGMVVVREYFLSGKGGALRARKKPLRAAGRKFWRGTLALSNAPLETGVC